MYIRPNPTIHCRTLENEFVDRRVMVSNDLSGYEQPFPRVKSFVKGNQLILWTDSENESNEQFRFTHDPDRLTLSGIVARTDTTNPNGET